MKIESRESRKSLRVVYISNMIPTKGYRDLAEAITVFKSKDATPISVIFIGAWGSQGEREDFEQSLQEWDITDEVEVLGAVYDRSNLKKLLQEADVFVLPTYYPVEAQPYSIIEALNSGTPVISTRHASIPEFIKTGRNGILVDIKSPQQIAEALISLENISFWRNCAEGARKTYLNIFSPEVVRKGLADVFNDCRA